MAQGVLLVMEGLLQSLHGIQRLGHGCIRAPGGSQSCRMLCDDMYCELHQAEACKWTWCAHDRGRDQEREEERAQPFFSADVVMPLLHAHLHVCVTLPYHLGYRC